jgi:hypothetical protein
MASHLDFVKQMLDMCCTVGKETKRVERKWKGEYSVS